MPHVFAWSSDANNSVGAEYILMEEAAGRPLAEVWDEMEIESKATIVEDLVAIEKKSLSIGFSK